MIAQKRLPPLGRRSPPPRHVLGHTCLSDINAELEQFAVDLLRIDAGGTIARLGEPFIVRRIRRSSSRSDSGMLAPSGRLNVVPSSRRTSIASGGCRTKF